MATLECGISHKDTKETDKFSNKKTKTTQKKTKKPQTNTFSKYSKDNTKKLDKNYTHVIQGPYNKQKEKNLHIL
jgi:hypothetical protein